jgi:predicted small secreted protein
MKTLIVILTTLTLSACGTVAGTLKGAGQDLQAAGKWIEPKPSVDLKEKK